MRLEMSSARGPFTLINLPDEVLQHVLYFMTPLDTCWNVQRVCKHLQSLGNEPLLWKHHCRVDFNYWDSRHDIRNKMLAEVAEVDWKSLYAERMVVDKKTSTVLDSILAGQTNRIEQFDTIGALGYDTKDALLRHCRVDDSAEDVLARR